MRGKCVFSRLFKVLLAIVALSGILDRAGFFSGDWQLHTLYSFTSISNAYILGITIFALVRTPKEFRPSLAALRYVGVVMILITGFVYHFALLPNKLAENPDYLIFTFGNIAAHYVVPAATLLDWLVFDRKGRVSKWLPAVCAGVPLLYFVGASLYGYLGSRIPGKDTAYPYFFMDWGELGAAGVLKWVSVILLVVLFLAYSVYAVDYLAGKRKTAPQ